MTNLRRFGAILLVLAAATAPFPVFAAEQPDEAKQIGAKLKCMCGGCDQSAGGCSHTGAAFSGPCETAKGMLKEIRLALGRGETATQILHSFEQQYGMAVYLEPPKSGFSLVAWVMPFAYLAAGTLLVIIVIKRWSSRAPRQQLATANHAPVSAEHLARARAQSEQEMDD
jgi:cytochrome c-type biogenesis protein CcmH